MNRFVMAQTSNESPTKMMTPDWESRQLSFPPLSKIPPKVYGIDSLHSVVRRFLTHGAVRFRGKTAMFELNRMKPEPLTAARVADYAARLSIPVSFITSCAVCLYYSMQGMLFHP